MPGSTGPSRSDQTIGEEKEILFPLCRDSTGRDTLGLGLFLWLFVVIATSIVSYFYISYKLDL